MKRLLLVLGLLVSLAITQVVFGQTDGVITYEVKVNLHRRLQANQESMKAMIPEFRITKQQLFFSANESMYKPLIEDEDEDATWSSSGGAQIKMRIPNDETYINPSSSMYLSKREFMGRDYLINDTLKVSPWKLGAETREIQGYSCKQAYYTDESIPGTKQEITAWYTDKIRPMLGPERFGTLPGTVLAVDVNNGERVIVAKQVEFRELKKNDIKVPANGQTVTQAEYRKIVDEQMKQMGGGNGRMMIRH